MAAIVNARDSLLQAASPRVLTVTLPDNVTIPDEKLPQVPTFMGTAKEVVLQISNRVFTVPTVGAITPSNIQITANLKNIVGTPTFTVTDGAVSLNVTGNTCTILPASMTTTTATIEVSVTYNSVVYKDSVTIAKAVEGGGVIGVLSNEYVTVPTDLAGNVLPASLAAAGGKFHVFKGRYETTEGYVDPATEAQEPAPTYSVVSATGVSVSINALGIYTINSVTTDNATATLRAVHSGTTIDRTYTLRIANIKSQVVGNRGSATISREITGAAWTDAEANLAIADAGFGTIMERDIVTLYNTAQGFSETKFYSGGQWQTMAAYVDGNMLINGTVTAEAITVDSLSALSANLGEVTTGRLNAGVIFAGDLEAATGTFAGALEAATGTFAGTLAAGVMNSSAFDGYNYEYNGAGTFNLTVPALKTGWTAMRVKITMQGGGAGGGGAAGSGSPNASKAATGGGGGAGAFVSVEYPVTPGSVLTLTVGAGGGGGAATGSQNATAASGGGGGQTKVVSSANSINVTASGGGAGGGAQIPWGTPGAGGAGGSVGGQSGVLHQFTAYGEYVNGGSGGSTRYGSGGAGRTASTGAHASGYGAGGAGGFAYCANADYIYPYAGGNGMNGRILIEIFDPNMVVLNSRYSKLVAWLDGIGHGAVPSDAR